MELTIPPGMAPPPHVHSAAETVYVVEGAVRYHIGDETFDTGPGAVFHIPAGTLEYFEPAGDRTMRVLLIFTPGGEDKFFTEAGEPAKAFEVPPPPTSPPDVERLVAIGARHGLEIRPPS